MKRHSHKVVEVTCEFNISDKCTQTIKTSYRNIADNRDRNNGKYICLYCSRKLKYTGRQNPNCKYKMIDDFYFKTIDTEEKAYILGWIASDGSISGNRITIQIHHRDIDVLDKIRRIICDALPIRSSRPDMVTYTISSTQLCADVCSHLCIKQGKKSGIIQFPYIDNDLYPAFIRGIFDGDGSLTNPLESGKNYLTANIANNSQSLRDGIKNIVKIPCHDSGTNLSWSCNNALDFLYYIYNNATIFLDRKYNLYKLWCQYVPGLNGIGSSIELDNKIKIIRTRKDAILPSKCRASDSGYDLTIIEKIKEVGEVSFYDTGIKTQLPFGWYLQVYPRSSIAKTGYMLANSVGIIDRTYLGNIIIALRKVDKKAQDITLPIKIAQMIPVSIIHMPIVEVCEFDDTDRGESGFGSTGR